MATEREWVTTCNEKRDVEYLCPTATPDPNFHAFSSLLFSTPLTLGMECCRGWNGSVSPLSNIHISHPHQIHNFWLSYSGVPEVKGKFIKCTEGEWLRCEGWMPGKETKRESTSQPASSYPILSALPVDGNCFSQTIDSWEVVLHPTGSKSRNKDWKFGDEIFN